MNEESAGCNGLESFKAIERQKVLNYSIVERCLILQDLQLV
jgi:hypothetical protein